MTEHLVKLYQKELTGELSSDFTPLAQDVIKKASWYILSDDESINLSNIVLVKEIVDNMVSFTYKTTKNTLRYDIYYSGKSKNTIKIKELRTIKDVETGTLDKTYMRDDFLPVHIEFDLIGIKRSYINPKLWLLFENTITVYEGVELDDEVTGATLHGYYGDYLRNGTKFKHWTQEDLKMFISLSKLVS